MAPILTSLRNTVIAGFLGALVLFLMYWHWGGTVNMTFWAFAFRWLHVISGVMWIGLLWYFNFVQMPIMPKIPDTQKAAVTKFIAPEALFWFRWAAMSTLVTGLILGHLSGYLVDALTLGAQNGFEVHKNIAIGIGMWLGIIMWFNVWFVIWPNQKIALGLVPNDDKDQKAKAARMAMLFSRTNVLLSIPLLFAMVSAQNIY